MGAINDVFIQNKLSLSLKTFDEILNFLINKSQNKIQNKKILKEIDKRKTKYEFIFENGTGNSYVKNLFINILIFFVDRFNIKELNDARFEILCVWAYSLRIVMHSVYIETINKYALGNHDRIDNENLFEKIAQMQKPQELDNIILNKPDKIEETYKEISEKLFGASNETN